MLTLFPQDSAMYICTLGHWEVFVLRPDGIWSAIQAITPPVMVHVHGKTNNFGILDPYHTLLPSARGAWDHDDGDDYELRQLLHRLKVGYPYSADCQGPGTKLGSGTGFSTVPSPNWQSAYCQDAHMLFLHPCFMDTLVSGRHSLIPGISEKHVCSPAGVKWAWDQGDAPWCQASHTYHLPPRVG